MVMESAPAINLTEKLRLKLLHPKKRPYGILSLTRELRKLGKKIRYPYGYRNRVEIEIPKKTNVEFFRYMTITAEITHGYTIEISARSVTTGFHHDTFKIEVSNGTDLLYRLIEMGHLNESFTPEIKQ